jgi:uncharacterized membrane protein YqhA
MPRRRLPQIIAGGRFFIVIAVICSFVASILILIYGGLLTFHSATHILGQGEISSKIGKKLVVSMIEVIDLFLLGTVFYITSLGLYELFIDEHIEVPKWLEIRTIDDLKARLISVVVVVLGVVFLGQAVSWDGESNLLNFGASVGLVIASLTFFLNTTHRDPKH